MRQLQRVVEDAHRLGLGERARVLSRLRLLPLLAPALVELLVLVPAVAEGAHLAPRGGEGEGQRKGSGEGEA